ncbi:MAG: RNA 2',3'-cyclic phosphodiesterase [Candidatus Aenigmarchaeota archaeon]|nr:RNA 2',3'-cyclic phosphodiesterase [Candidatus Aenigmarchaeota archaeon]
MRAFLGVSVNDALKPRITQVLDALDHFDVKQVEPKNLHFNLRFFSYISPDDAENLKDIVSGISRRHSSFEVELYGVGAFPSKNIARVLWLGVRDGYEKFKSFGDDIENSVSHALGLEKEKEFRPHMTLGRVRSGSNSNELLVFLRKYENIEIGRMRIDKITLFKSLLEPKGPKYEEVFSIKI